MEPARLMNSRTEALPASTLIEHLFFAYRDFTGDPDTILAQFGFGRAHHRVLHFIDRKPGLTVAELLDLLKITKQSLARVLKQLVDGGYVCQKPGPVDRRQRELYLTESGQTLIRDPARATVSPHSVCIAANGLRGGGYCKVPVRHDDRRVPAADFDAQCRRARKRRNGTG